MKKLVIVLSLLFFLHEAFSQVNSENGFRFKNTTQMKGLIWGNAGWANFYSRIDDYNGNLRIMSDDHIHFTDININNGLPAATAVHINTNTPSLAIGSNVVSGKSLYVNGNTQFNGNLFSENEIRFKNNTQTKGLVWGSSNWANFYSRIDDYNGNLRIMTDDHIYFTDINSADGKPTNTALYINTNNSTVGIGTTSTGSHKLAVEGSIGAREVRVEPEGWSDFVFEDDYKLRTLEEVEVYLSVNKHLPEIPSAKEVTENGINLGDMNAKLLQKIEELTLYMIAMNKRMKQLEKENSELKNEVYIHKK